MKIILASASPRRKSLMEVLGLDFDIIVSDCEEKIDSNLNIEDIVMSLALQKAEAVAASVEEDSLVIGADTVVYCDGEILGKPKDFDDASRMLNLLNNKTHNVYTGFAVINTSDNSVITDFEKSDVTFKNLTQNEIDDYIRTCDPLDKAGSYSIQGIASSFIDKLEGDYNNVVGLPIYKLSKYLYNSLNGKGE